MNQMLLDIEAIVLRLRKQNPRTQIHNAHFLARVGWAEPCEAQHFIGTISSWASYRQPNIPYKDKSADFEALYVKRNSPPGSGRLKNSVNCHSSPDPLKIRPPKSHREQARPTL